MIIFSTSPAAIQNSSAKSVSYYLPASGPRAFTLALEVVPKTSRYEIWPAVLIQHHFIACLGLGFNG